jgi:hypothetical protein
MSSFIVHAVAPNSSTRADARAALLSAAAAATTAAPPARVRAEPVAAPVSLAVRMIETFASSIQPPQSDATPVPSWLSAALRDVYADAAVEFVGGGAGGASHVVRVLRDASVAATVARGALIAAIQSCVATHVRELLTADGGSMEERVLPRALNWARENIIPFAASALLREDELSSLAHAAHGVPASAEIVSTLRAAGVLTTTAARLPHSNAPMCFTPFAQVDGIAAAQANCAPRRDTPASDAANYSVARVVLLRDCVEVSFRAVHECVARARTEQAFDIVRDFPSTAPAIEDLRESISIAGEAAAAALVHTLVLSLRTRLLHAGAATSSILDIFLSTMRVLWCIDGPGGVLTTLVAEPIQSYLRTRADAIRCIVSSLTEDASSELYQELLGNGSGSRSHRGRAAAHDTYEGDVSEDSEGEVGDAPGDSKQAEDGGAEDSCEMDDGDTGVLSLVRLLFAAHKHEPPHTESVLGEQDADGSGYRDAFTWLSAAPAAAQSKKEKLWQPALLVVDAARLRDPTGSLGRAASNSRDLLSLLLNIYGSTDLFIAEYRALLSERLAGSAAAVREMTPGNWDVSNEERTVELLKLRFGETALASAEVMLKDVGDSKRVAIASAAAIKQREGAADVSEESAVRFSKAGAWDVSMLETKSAFDALIISQHYWPSSTIPREAGVELHPALVSTFNVLAREYTDLKKPRTIAAVPALGCVEIDVVMPPDSTIVSASGTPQQVSLLLAFADAGGVQVPLAALAERLRAAVPVVLRLTSHWVARNVLALERTSSAMDTWIAWAASAVPSANDARESGAGMDEEAAGPATLGAPPEAIEVWSSYVFGMLSCVSLSGSRAFSRDWIITHPRRTTLSAGIWVLSLSIASRRRSRCLHRWAIILVREHARSRLLPHARILTLPSRLLHSRPLCVGHDAISRGARSSRETRLLRLPVLDSAVVNIDKLIKSYARTL